MINASRVLVALLLVLLLSCDETEFPGSTPHEISMKLVPSLVQLCSCVFVGQTTVVTCTYKVTAPDDSVRTWHAQGRLSLFGNWQYVSGDTVWSDTLRTFDEKHHTVFLRPAHGGILGLGAKMSARSEGGYPDPITGEGQLSIRALGAQKP